MPSDTLVYVPFTPDLLAVVGDFDCGAEPYQQELAHWIAQDSVPAREFCLSLEKPAAGA